MARVKSAAVKLKAGPDDGLQEGQFEAYASVFGNKDSYGDIVLPGAFAETLAEWKDSGNVIPLLFGHNMSDPDYNIGGVVDAKEDDKGLLTLNQLDLENPKAVQTYRLLKGRRINQMSFAYDILEGGEAQSKDDDGKQEYWYELRKLKLYEVSVVPIGANQETEILAVKALENLAGVTLTVEQKAALLPAYHALGGLLGQQGKQDAATASAGKSSKDADEASSKAAGKASVVERLAAELEILGLG